MKSSLKNMVIVLLIITAVASASVGGVYVATKAPIEKAQIEKTNNAISDVMPQFDNDPSADKIKMAADGDTVLVYPATMGGEPVGYAVECFSKNGFGGKMGLLVGFTPEGEIINISVLQQSETPGLGDKINPDKSDFSLQFQGKDPATMNLTVKKDGGDVDAITASTISSRAYCEALVQAYNTFKSIEK